MEPFLVARNPEPGTNLPFLVRLPIEGGLVLKCGSPWPATARVYCHPYERGWPDDAEVVDRSPVRSCQRRGPAIDLVLARGRNVRSQFVFTSLRGGRPAIFWQTAKVARAARPGVRVPARRASGAGPLELLVDTRERYPFKFARQQASTVRRALPAGDYGVERDGQVLAVVERKAVADFTRSLSDGSLAFELAHLATMDRAAVVVEGRYGALLKQEHVQPGWLLDLVARLQVRYPAVPIVFADSRLLAEEWTFRFLGAARAELAGPEA
jgi:hypothetical protein